MGLKTHPLFQKSLYENLSILPKFSGLGLHSDYEFFLHLLIIFNVTAYASHSHQKTFKAPLF